MGLYPGSSGDLREDAILKLTLAFCCGLLRLLSEGALVIERVYGANRLEPGNRGVSLEAEAKHCALRLHTASKDQEI
jgi:hypothetical protein